MDPLLNRLKSKALTLSLENCRFNKKEVEFFGLTLSKAGVYLKDEKATALRKAHRPKNASELYHSFLGLAVLCSKYFENFATVSAPM